jgi:transposase
MEERGGEGLSRGMNVLVADAGAQWVDLDRRISAFDAEFVRATRESVDAKRLTTIPGVGPTTASALVAAVGKAAAVTWPRPFRLAGFCAQTFTTGGKAELLGITKRGDKYIRKLLIHGARSALPHLAERHPADLGRLRTAAAIVNRRQRQ